MLIPNIWKGMFKLARPQGERKPLTNITKKPSDAPIMLPNTTPVVKVMREVNSRPSGLGTI
jgi:hypothetical protein